MTDYQDVWYRSTDGLQLYARDYHAGSQDTPLPKQQVSNRPTVLCMHGLTRNSADFADLAGHLSAQHRVVVVDNRGRGRSDYDSTVANYNPQTYVRDMFTLLDHLDIERVVLVGTSMGGLMALLMTFMRPERTRAIILNDIGPEIEPAGLARIVAYVGGMPPVANWREAVDQAREINGEAFPDFNAAQWLAFAQGIYVEHNGVPVLAYDPGIAQAMTEQRKNTVPVDLWPVFAATTDVPLLVLRGAHSDILAPGCVKRMRDIKPDLRFAEVPLRGHAPMLNEVESMSAIDAFLQSVM